jgi:hypothetical protein
MSKIAARLARLRERRTAATTIEYVNQGLASNECWRSSAPPQGEGSEDVHMRSAKVPPLIPLGVATAAHREHQSQHYESPVFTVDLTDNKFSHARTLVFSSRIDKVAPEVTPRVAWPSVPAVAAQHYHRAACSSFQRYTAAVTLVALLALYRTKRRPPPPSKL